MPDTDALEQPAATLVQRLISAGIGETRAREHIQRGVVHVHGAVVTDADAPEPWPAPWVIGSDC